MLVHPRSSGSMTGCLHGEYGCDGIQRGNDDANLTNASCQQQGPGGLPVSFAMPKYLSPIKEK